ncbi:MAG: uracil-DNA glycosylase [Gammaproteobacteria bacterium]|nr:uracil-DNA glycosylase [Gammaproteobacteria bacterium]
MLSARQQHCLEGIGIQVWSERKSGDGDRSSTGSAPVAFAEDEIEALHQFIDPTQQSDAKTMVPAEKQDPAPAPDSADETEQLEPSITRDLESWDAIIDSIQHCNACELSGNCTQKVPGVGDRQASLLIVGEGPGHDEDIQGEPFVGRSGQLLDRMLATIGIARDQVYITNIVKCRPPNNRDPKQGEARHCRTYLEAQIKQIAPKVILSVGRVSAHNLLGSTDPVGKLIKQMHTLPGTEIPLKVTYHPAYLLRNPSAKAIAWQDLKLLHQMLQ